ncbi:MULTISPECIES: ABC transporter ATP-binding protein [unclassified Tolypothrix]|uniref:ABC transporter ATP-binding protein n=1 Tax=unclassified Tolypothrix TaxID=2649714 RepID=UPI0005EABD06|nr:MULTISPECIES: ABC transporter ATP-binding protein [unclassified Tolypothrix]BAY95945.1 ABC transporter-related protein [Microchaete diplosiphon NIES-3275]EKE96533.1 ABC transporter, ATP-binding protein [Tolypothrix sp. PCC 7601]MBE9084092.1 ABC transporter ATP-binding protein [Tolypothrix sp. LEGE 11397]UYD31016.1 ABC transporter ATP-binding protein [Tolypothrix sp. PCC 7712]UYD38877.1 ABC transporter ATP-binding protein [Tolypothrix sp. PCC 7601]
MNNFDSEDRYSEIESLVASNELDIATKRLMDFAKNFLDNSKTKFEIIDIRAKYVELSREMRCYGVTDAINNRLTELRFQILEFATYIKTNQQLNNPDINNLEEPGLILSKSEQLQINYDNPYQNDDNQGTTQLEIAKMRFLEKQKSQKKSNSSFVFECKEIYKSYKNNLAKFILSNINITLNLGEITAVVGENGNGKTTLLRIIAGELAPSGGHLSYPCLNVNSKNDICSIKRQIAYIPQELPKMPGLVVDNLHFAAAIHGITGSINKEEVEFIIYRLALEQYRDAKWSELSGGYKMRFSLAQALVCNPKLLILDEPLANLDINTQLLFLQDLRDFANYYKEKKSIIISSQNLYEIEKIADNIIFLKNGQAKYNNSVKNFGKDRTKNCYEIDCSLSKEELESLLKEVNYKKIDKSGISSFIIYTDTDVMTKDLLEVFLAHKISLKYFRDISKSTRTMFDEELV